MKRSRMNRILLIAGFVVNLIVSSQAQSIYKGQNNDNSTFLFGAINARKSQCLYKPSDFSSLPQMGEIIKIYYRYGSTGDTVPNNLSPFTIKLGQTNDTVFPPGNTFFTGLTTVRYDSVFTIPPGVQGNWFGIDLQTPFVYDSSKTLIVEIKFYNSTVSNFGTLGNTNLTQKLISADTGAFAQTSFGSTTWQDFGFDYIITTGKTNINTNKEVQVFPIPCSGLITINNLNFTNEGAISVYDVYGKLVITKNYKASKSTENIDITSLESGIYFLKIESQKESIVKRIIKN